MFPDEFCAHFSWLNCILIPFPPQNSDQFFSLLSASTLQILRDTSHIPLESPFGTVLCLWFLLPLLINRVPCTLIARNMPSPGKRRWEQQSLRWVTWRSLEADLESGADETSALWSPTYSGPFLDTYYLNCTFFFLKRVSQIILF